MKITFILHTVFFLPFLFPQMYCYLFPSDVFSSFFPDVFSYLPCFSTRSVFIVFFSFLQMYFHSDFHHMCFHSFCFFSSKYNFILSISLRQMYFNLFLQMTSIIPSKCICIHSSFILVYNSYPDVYILSSSFPPDMYSSFPPHVF